MSILPAGMMIPIDGCLDGLTPPITTFKAHFVISSPNPIDFRQACPKALPIWKMTRRDGFGHVWIKYID